MKEWKQQDDASYYHPYLMRTSPFRPELEGRGIEVGPRLLLKGGFDAAGVAVII
jgi:hypothetical protein